jgi:hypothetical protein
MKDLSVSCVSWTSNRALVLTGAEILDVREDNVGGFALEFAVLTTAL